MSDEFRREHRFIVLNLNDMRKYLDTNDFNALSNILSKITKGRLGDGKPINSYIVCNEDEPYAGEIWRVIADGEAKKHQNDFRGHSS